MISHTRWEEFRDDFGASWDFDGYHPHVTITYEGLPEGLKLEDIEPYQGELKFGPEIVDEVNDNWKGGVKEKKLTEQFLYETPEQVETKPFKEWFKNSKVVGPDGKPIVVYHGTGSNFKAFNMKKQVMGIIWFTSNKADIEAGEVGAQGSGKILELYASIQNPADWKAYDQLGLGELIGRGYDGAILPDRDGHFTGFVFQPSQLKSATKNRGNFDRHQNSLYEKMVHLDSREHDGYDVAIDPTRQEWNKYFAKYGAAGVFLKSGSIVVGDGEALDHLFLLRMASVDYSQELYRLQLYPDKVVIEMWDELGDIEHEPSPEEIESLTKFPKTIRQKAALTVKPVVARFMGNVPVIVELKSGISGDNWLEEQY